MDYDKTYIIYLLDLCFFLFLIMTVGAGYFIFKKFGNPIPNLIKEFDKKMWITIGLGIVFFGAYIALVYLASWKFKASTIFEYLYQHTSEAIYIGLAIFVFVTLAIYLMRLIIMALYRYRSPK